MGMTDAAKRGIILICMLTIAIDGLYAYEGRIIDSENNIGIAGAVVKELTTDNQVLLSTQTDSIGQFQIKSNDNRAERLYVGCPGYTDRVFSIDSLLAAPFIEIALNPYLFSELDEIVVTASTNTTHGNVETFLITDKMRENTMTAIGLIDKLPGFTVNPMTENVRMGAISDLKIVVDGQEVSKSYYNAINPKRIKKIELIRNSSGKYSQYPAVLNIVLNKSYEGLDMNIRSKYLQRLANPGADTENVSAGLTSSYRRWHYFINGDFSRTHSFETTGRDLSLLDSINITTLMPPVSNPNKRKNGIKWSANAGAGASISENQTISGQFLYDRSSNRENDATETITNNASGKSDIDSRYLSDNYVAGLVYNYKVSNKIRLNADLTYNAYRIKQRQNTELEGNTSHILMHGDKDYLTAFANATFKIRGNWFLAAAYEYTWRRYDTHSDSDSRAKYTESRNRPVVETSFQLGKFSANVGVSYLDIAAKNDNTSQHNRSFLPRVSLFWQPLRMLSFGVNYYSKTEYPNLDMLSPQRWIVADCIVREGNPDLEANTTHYIETRIKLFNMLTLNYTYRHTDNDVSPIYYLVNLGSSPFLLETYANTNISHLYAGLQFSKDFFDELSCDITASRQWYDRKYAGTHATGRTWYLDCALNWNVLKSGYLLGANLFLRDDRRPLPQGYESDHEENLLISALKMFYKNRLAVTFGINIPTKFVSHMNRRTIHTKDFRYEQTDNLTRNCTWTTLLNISYTFSNGRSSNKDNQLRFEKEKY